MLYTVAQCTYISCNIQVERASVRVSKRLGESGWLHPRELAGWRVVAYYILWPRSPRAKLCCFFFIILYYALLYGDVFVIQRVSAVRFRANALSATRDLQSAHIARFCAIRLQHCIVAVFWYTDTDAYVQ